MHLKGNIWYSKQSIQCYILNNMIFVIADSITPITMVIIIVVVTVIISVVTMITIIVTIIMLFGITCC